ncbi:MAG: amidohydrolase family protein [Desulfobacterales bacterium]|nr:amidohydrolase family protein [Desulfobacterales bacterium]
MKNPFLILAGWLVDGSGDSAFEKILLEIRRGLIVSIKKAGPDDRKRADLIDLSRFTLIPGLVDSHVHLALSGTDDFDARRHQLGALFKEVKGVISAHLRDQLLCGVVAVRDGGDYGGHALRYKQERPPDGEGRIALRTAGRGWHAPGRYGRLVGRTPLKGHTLARSIIKAHKGIDHVKIVNSGLNSLSNFGEETLPQFSREELEEAVGAAHSIGLKTMVHANGKLPVRLAIEAGCDSIEHGYFMGRENLMRMSEKKITWVPTASPMAAYARSPGSGSPGAEIARKNLEHQLDQIHAAAAYGVPIAVGTDAGSPGVHHGQAIREEIQLLVRAGLPIEKAIQCASSVGADLLDLGDGAGRLSPGRPATFVVTRGGPGELLDSLESPEGLFIMGESIFDGEMMP